MPIIIRMEIKGATRDDAIVEVNEAISQIEGGFDVGKGWEVYGEADDKVI